MQLRSRRPSTAPGRRACEMRSAGRSIARRPWAKKLQRGSLLSRSDYLEHLFKRLPRIDAASRSLAERLLHSIDDLALRLQCFALGVKLDVSLLQLRHCDSHLLLYR